MPDIVCEHCGDTDFYKEAGFFYCSGCQIQSQEVHELVFDNEGEMEAKNRPKKIQSDKGDKPDNKITSWECYNYILLGLTNELINLGSDKSLRRVVRILWLRYLEKLQVFKRNKDEIPRLQAVSSLKDAEIVYGRAAKRKRKRSNKSSSDETDPTTLDSSSMKRERAKKRRALVQAHYEDFTQKSQGTTPSLHNETLTSLQTGSEKSSTNKPISYNIYASKELRKKQTYYHIRKHKLDFDRDLRCHHTTYRKTSNKYQSGPYILSLNKLYVILYLGLLIIKDKIQLGDMLRFIQEGHLSFNCYTHLFPDDFTDKSLNFRNFTKNATFSSIKFRRLASEMADFLQIDWYITRPDLVSLANRYCKELNLPDEFCKCVKNIMSRTDIGMSFRKRGAKIPNYEGRVLSIILFLLKLLFGLDGVTENHLAQYANSLNQSKSISKVFKMFNIIQWLKFIEYRNEVMASWYFPANFLKYEIKNVDLAVNFLSKKDYPENKTSKKKEKYKHVLNMLKDRLEKPKMAEFPPTLTPFHDYTKLLHLDNYLDILSNNFTDHSLVHILRPNKFLEILNQGAEPLIVNGGANEDWVIERIVNPVKDSKRRLADSRKLITVKLTLSRPKMAPIAEDNAIDVETFTENYYYANVKNFKRNSKRLANQSQIINFNFRKIRKELSFLSQRYSVHYNPYERYWIRTIMDIEAINRSECSKFLEKFPNNFRIIFREFQRITQQSEQELLAEYQLTELHLAYSADFKMKMKKKRISNKTILKFLDKTKYLW